MKIRAGQIVGETKLGFEILGSITLKLSGPIYRTTLYSATVSDNTSEDVLAISGNRPVLRVPDAVRNQTITTFNEVEQSED